MTTILHFEIKKMFYTISQYLIPEGHGSLGWAGSRHGEHAGGGGLPGALWREKPPEGQATDASLPRTLIFILHAYKSVKDLFLFHVRGGKRETFISPTRLLFLKSEDKSTSEVEHVNGRY